ncbi:MAG: hypothetical protein ACK4QW_07885 [Alphaproteobacteria bacterium]
MIAGPEIARSLHGAFRLAARDPAGLQWFDTSIRGFWNSFFAAVLVAPFYMAVVATRPDEPAVTVSSGAFALTELIAYVCGWFAFPLVMVYVTRAIGREALYIPYIVAASVVRGKFGLAELEADVIGDRQILELAAKVDYEVDPDSPFPNYYSGDVTIETVDGRILHHREEKNRGAGDRPLSTDDIVAKFMDNAMLAVSRERAERIRDLVLALDGLGEALELEEGLGG